MLMILVANLIASKLKQSHMPLLGIGIFAGLVLAAFLPTSKLLFLGPVAGALLGSFVCLLPMIFAAMFFALLFRDTKTPGQALAFNLVGGVLGVFLEYFSMVWGVQSLSFISMVIYAVPVFLAIKANKKPPVLSTDNV